MEHNYPIKEMKHCLLKIKRYGQEMQRYGFEEGLGNSSSKHLENAYELRSEIHDYLNNIKVLNEEE